MKKKLLSVLVLAVLFGLLVACSNGSVPVDVQNEDVSVTQREEVQGIHGFLTRIEYGDNVAYLFGDYSLTRPDWLPFAPIVEEAMQRADVFFVREDPNVFDDPLVLEFVLERGYLPQGATLAEYLPLNIYEHLMYYMDSYDIDTWFIGDLAPSVVVGSNIPSGIAYKLNAESFFIADFIANYARDAGLPFYTFFDPFWFYDLMFPISEEVQFAAAQTITYMEDALAQLEAILNAYEQQDKDLLVELLRYPIYDGMNAYKRHRMEQDRLIAEEFRFGIGELLRKTEDATTFFIPIWVGNMIGNDNADVVWLLENDGFSVARMYE